MGPTARGGFELTSAVGPDRMGSATVGNEPLVIPLLVAVINRGTWEDSVAVVLVRTDRAYAHIGRAKGDAAIVGLREVRIGHEAGSGGVVASIVERYIHIAGDGINREPMVEAIDWARKLVRDRPRSGPGGTAVIGVGEENV